MADSPETYHCSRTTFVPNKSTKRFLESNGWVHGGTWGAVPRHHFHPNTHECYAIFQGSSTLILGIGPFENPSGGQEVVVRAGDAIILPAGVSHCSKEFKDGYRYAGVYPRGSPQWKNEYCRDEARCQELRDEAERVLVPDWDPIRGYRGSLFRLWTESLV